MASTAELSILITGKNQAGKAFADAEKNVSGFSKALAGVGKIASGVLAADVIQSGLAKVTEFMGTSIAAYKESQLAAAQLGAVLKSTGGAAGVTAEQVTAMASALEKASLFEDEAIIKGQSMLLTFTNIGSTVFPQATQAIVDMSQAMGQDLQSSAVQVGKALNDPIAGISALSRVGVTFNEQQKEQIRLMVESGNVAGAQTLILAELSKEFGGSALAASEAAGASEVQKDKMNELSEVIGQKLLPLQEKWMEVQVAAITYLVDVAIPATERWLEQHQEIVTAIEQVAGVTQQNWPLIEQVINVALVSISNTIEAFILLVRGISAVLSEVVAAVEAVINGPWAAAWETFKQIPADMLQLVEGMFRDAFAGADQWLVQAGSDIINGLWNGMKSKWEDTKGWVGGLGDTIKNLKGPIAQDRVLLKPEGVAIMEGLGTGMRQGAASPLAIAAEIGGQVRAAALAEIPAWLGGTNFNAPRPGGGGGASGGGGGGGGGGGTPAVWAGVPGTRTSGDASLGVAGAPLGKGGLDAWAPWSGAPAGKAAVIINVNVEGSIHSDKGIAQIIRDSIDGGGFRGVYAGGLQR